MFVNELISIILVFINILLEAPLGWSWKNDMLNDKANGE